MELVSKLEELLSDPTTLSLVGGSILVFVLCSCRIFHKAGYNAALGLLMLVPGINLLMLFKLGFSRWPIERELRSYRKIQRTVHRTDSRIPGFFNRAA